MQLQRSRARTLARTRLVQLALSCVGLLGLTTTIRAQTITEIIDQSGDGQGNGLNGSKGLAVDAAGNVYLAGIYTDNVFRISPGGLIIEIIDSTGDKAGNTLAGAIEVAVDGAGNVYVTGMDSDNAFKIAPDGTITEIIDLTGAGPGKELDRPQGIAVDAQGNVYVAGWFSDNAFKITPGGVITEIIDKNGDGAGNVLNHALGITVDGTGNVYVTGSTSNNAFQITPAGSITRIIDASGDKAGHALSGAQDVCVGEPGKVYVAGSFSDNVFEIEDPGGTNTITQIIDSSGDGMGHPLGYPYAVTADGLGNVFVVGSTSDNAFKVAPGILIQELIDKTGDGKGNTLTDPEEVAVDALGNVYVSGLSGTDNAFKIGSRVTLGTVYCTPAVRNSSGLAATVQALGSDAVADDQLELRASDMPADQFGYFLASETQGFVANPGGSQGNLCLGGNVARFAKQVQDSGPAGTFSIPVDLGAIPTSPPSAVLAGETWNFQAWFRDASVGSSNFTDGVSVLFQ